MNEARLITGRGGLGDAIYARPFVRAACEKYRSVFVETSWPELFADLPVHPVKRVGGLAAQAYHGEKVSADVWKKVPTGAKTVSLRYRWARIARMHSVQSEMEALSNIHPHDVAPDLPPLPPSPFTGRYAVLRPPAVRCDYPAPAREPLPEYLSAASQILSQHGYTVITVGHFVRGLEEPNGDVYADVRYEHGELTLMSMLALVASASVVVSAPGFLLPAAIAARVSIVCIAGGCGGRNNPAGLVDKRIDADVRWLLPDNYCMCSGRFHACPKVIPGFADRFADMLSLPTSRAA